jgi:branched-subunit amino acid transport protein AzlD
MNTKMALIAIFVSAVITFGLRALPFLVFQEGKEFPDQIKRLGMVSSIMAVLIVYCLKDVGDDFMADGLWKLIAAAITAVSYKWKHNTLISILLGTVSYMMFLHFFG